MLEHVPETCTQVDMMTEFIPMAPMEKVQLCIYFEIIVVGVHTWARDIKRSHVQEAESGGETHLDPIVASQEKVQGCFLFMYRNVSFYFSRP